jgi:DNA-binding NtrC family response regulator
LRSLGYKVKTAINGHQAIELVKQEKFDVIILDMIMEEDFDGLETYREIIKINPGQKAIIASGFSETDRVKEAEKLGVGKYIRKPYTMQILGKSIREVLVAEPHEAPVF